MFAESCLRMRSFDLCPISLLASPLAVSVHAKPRCVVVIHTISLEGCTRCFRISNYRDTTRFDRIRTRASRMCSSKRKLGRVALPTVQRRLALSGKLCFNSLWPVTNVTGQGNRLRSWIVREKRGGLGITVKATNTRKTNERYNQWIDFKVSV